MSKKPLTEKLKRFRESTQLSIRAMAKELGLQPTTYNHYETRYKEEFLPRKFHSRIRKLAEKYKIDSDLLSSITGVDEDDPDQDTHLIPVYDFHAGMGGGGVVESEDPIYHMPLPVQYLQRIGLALADLMALEVRGDSNAPTLLSGDQILIDRKDQQVGQEGLFCLFDSDGVVVKRVEKIRPITDPIMLRLISDNPHHSSYDVPAVDLRIIGRVVWFGRRI